MKRSIQIFALCIALVACEAKKAQNDLPANTSSVAVQVAKVEQKTVKTAVVGSGLLSSSQEAKPSFKIGGVIQGIYVKEGDRIRRGQVLAKLNPTEINLQVAQAEEGFAKAQRDYKRVQSLYKDSVATEEQSQNVGTALNVAKQSLEIAKYNQSYATIVSNVDGVVVKKLMNEGEIVGAGTPILFINATTEADWVLKIGVSDKDWTRVQEGDQAEVSLDAYPDMTFTGTVKTLSQGADPTTGSYQIEIKVQTQGKRLATGMFGKAHIHTAIASQYQVVPVESIIEGAGKNAFVYIPKGNKVQKISVQVAQIEQDKALISKGLEQVSQVISTGAGFLAENSTIVLK
jgi:RND family efflux transporter MFP subunit